jgi:hypothetical protein
MKVALVLTGLARCWEKAYPSFKQYFIDRYDTDVYIDIWSEVGYYNGSAYLQSPTDEFVKLADGDKGFHTSGERVDVNKLIEVYNPAAIRVEDFSKFEPTAEELAVEFTKAYTRPKNTISQAYKIYQGLDLTTADYEHDLVVRARPDLVIEHDPGMFELDTIYTLPSRNKIGKGTGDALQIGPLWDMIEFSHMFFGLESLYRQTGVSCPHMFTEAQIKFCQLINRKLKWKELSVGAHVAHSPKGLYQNPE